MKHRAPLILATTPYWQESGETLARVRGSLPDDRELFGWYHYEGAIRHFVLGGQYANESALRAHGLKRASELGATWWLQLDADERLVDGEKLAAMLETWPRRAFPLPRREEDGRWQLCPYKLVRLPAELVCGCDHFTWRADTGWVVWQLSGYGSPPESLGPLLEKMPHLLHEPSRRGARDVPRLGVTEGILETRPASVPWPIDVNSPFMEAR